MDDNKTKFACLALSGGMDSTSLLLHLLAKNYQVTAVSFLYGQKHHVEVHYAEQLIAYLASQGYHVRHHIITLDGLEKVLFSALIQHGSEVPEGLYAPDNMQATVVPNRNKIFISILQAAALSIAEKEQAPVVVALGIHAGDYLVYPDCRAAFIDQDYQAFLVGNWQAQQVSNYLPYLQFDKYGILQDGLLSTQQLALDFDEIYKRTITSYKPNSQGISDYKSASSVQRISAFIKLNRADPITYADDTGVVDWQVAKQHVEGVLSRQDL